MLVGEPRGCREDVKDWGTLIKTPWFHRGQMVSTSKFLARLPRISNLQWEKSCYSLSAQSSDLSNNGPHTPIPSQYHIRLIKSHHLNGISGVQARRASFSDCCASESAEWQRMRIKEERVSSALGTCGFWMVLEQHQWSNLGGMLMMRQFVVLVILTGTTLALTPCHQCGFAVPQIHF